MQMGVMVFLDPLVYLELKVDRCHHFLEVSSVVKYNALEFL